MDRDGVDLELSKSDEYLEKDLPQYLQKSIAEMEKEWTLVDTKQPNQWDLAWYDLCSDINIAEVDGRITKKQAHYLRIKYLRYVEE